MFSDRKSATIIIMILIICELQREHIRTTILLYYIILYTCNSRGTRRRYTMHLAVCSYNFFFVPLSTPPLLIRFIFSPTSLTNLIHYYYYPDTWCIVIGTIGVVYCKDYCAKVPCPARVDYFHLNHLTTPFPPSLFS